MLSFEHILLLSFEYILARVERGMDFACVGFGIHFCLVLPGQVFSSSEAQTWFALNARRSVVGLNTVRGQLNSYPESESAG